jgi:NAD(P)-dependent dehydrogenase (short-subunit alcohol dehydrogenase family)
VLILSGRRQAELEATASKLRQGTQSEIVTGDVSKDEDVERMFAVIKEKYGRVDVVFNVSTRSPFVMFRGPISVRRANLTERRSRLVQRLADGGGRYGQVPASLGDQRHVGRLGSSPRRVASRLSTCVLTDQCTKEAIKIMKEQSPRGGRIINNGSISASSPRPSASGIPSLYLAQAPPPSTDPLP